MARIETEEQLRALYGEVKGRAGVKVIPRLEKHSRRYIGLAPFVALATQAADGRTDVTPRGEAPGFVRVLDDATLAIPDRPGNNRLDSFTNILGNPGVGLMFLIPGIDEVLRVNGTAEIRDDEDLRAMFEVDGKRPKTVLVVSVREVFLHCAKALMRSRLWDADAQVERAVLPPTGRMMNDQIGGGTDAPVEDQDAMIARYRKVLY